MYIDNVVFYQRVKSWTADRLERRGWQNCGICNLCNEVQELAAHLLFKCRFTTSIWNTIKDWLSMHDIFPSEWHHALSVKEWWSGIINGPSNHRKALVSLAMLISWELWKERNAFAFRNQYTTTAMMVHKIKEETRLWTFAGAKALRILVPRE